VDEKELAGWKKQLASGKGYAQASCNFAELVWAGNVSQRQQVDLLQSDDVNVRRAVSWAVADLARDDEAMRHLIRECFNDADSIVRLNAWWAISQAVWLSQQDKERLIERLGDEQDARVLKQIRAITAQE
jgi:hypothetical protein